MLFLEDMVACELVQTKLSSPYTASGLFDRINAMLPKIRSSIIRTDTTLSSFLAKFPKAKQEAYK